MDTKLLTFGVIKETAIRMNCKVGAIRRRIVCDDPEALLVVAEVEKEWRDRKARALAAVYSALGHNNIGEEDGDE